MKTKKLSLLHLIVGLLVLSSVLMVSCNKDNDNDDTIIPISSSITFNNIKAYCGRNIDEIQKKLQEQGFSLRFIPDDSYSNDSSIIWSYYPYIKVEDNDTTEFYLYTCNNKIYGVGYYFVSKNTSLINSMFKYWNKDVYNFAKVQTQITSFYGRINNDWYETPNDFYINLMKTDSINESYDTYEINDKILIEMDNLKGNFIANCMKTTNNTHSVIISYYDYGLVGQTIPQMEPYFDKYFKRKK